MDETQQELNGRIKITINNNYITNRWDEPFHTKPRFVNFEIDDASVQTVNRVNNSQPITDTPPTSALSKKSIGEKRIERFWKEKQAAKNINNNYIYGLPNEPPNKSHAKMLPASSQNNRKREIPEELKLLLKQSLEETMPLLILDGFEPSSTCTCGGAIRIIQCRMCGAQGETNCFLHQAVGNNGIMTRCSQPTCYSDKLIELRNI